MAMNGKHIRVISAERPAFAQFQTIYDVVGIVQGLMGAVSMVMSNKYQMLDLVDRYRMFEKEPAPPVEE